MDTETKYFFTGVIVGVAALLLGLFSLLLLTVGFAGKVGVTLVLQYDLPIWARILLGVAILAVLMLLATAMNACMDQLRWRQRVDNTSGGRSLIEKGIYE